ncbi:LuxR C-terminal-related transcriptional regulator [Streptomyces sp. NPDC053493]|uniref:LuxR C-terminal-related transcriptional regulator n=1 Tax=Streptomyces sp. NPDC053493 TaxID=3365705 RepID=UPI0037D12400
MITTGGVTEEGRTDGLAEGLAKGLAEGLAEGAAKGVAAGLSDGRLVALYQELRRRGVSNFPEVAGSLGLSPEEFERCRTELVTLGLIVPTTSTHATSVDLRDAAWRPDEDAVASVDPEIALLRVLDQERARLREHLAEADQAYSTLETLAGTFLRPGSLTRSEIAVETITDYRRIQQALEDIIDVTQEASCSMYPTGPARQVPERIFERDRRKLAHGVRVRAIYRSQDAVRPEAAEVLNRRAELGVEVRIAPDLPMTMVIVDEQYAIVPLRPEAPGEGAILARGPLLVRSFLSLYEHCWHTATPYGDDVAPERGGDGLSEQQRAALQMLAAGMKDEKIARNLGVSLRTVSRMLSELMQELGASSRFEAGVRAVRLGWLD